VSSLNRIDTSRAKASSRPGSPEWCELVEQRALERALRTAEGSSQSAADISQLMKIRKGLSEKLGIRPKVTWVDPERWKLKPPADA